MRRFLPHLVCLAGALGPVAAAACGLGGAWLVSSEDGYTGIFIIEEEVDRATCEARLNVFSPVGASAAEACRVLRLRSGRVAISCEVLSASPFPWHPDTFLLEPAGDVMAGRWLSDISSRVVFSKQ